MVRRKELPENDVKGGGRRRAGGQRDRECKKGGRGRSRRDGEKRGGGRKMRRRFCESRDERGSRKDPHSETRTGSFLLFSSPFYLPALLSLLAPETSAGLPFTQGKRRTRRKKNKNKKDSRKKKEQRTTIKLKADCVPSSDRYSPPLTHSSHRMLLRSH